LRENGGQKRGVTNATETPNKLGFNQHRKRIPLRRSEKRGGSDIFS